MGFSTSRRPLVAVILVAFIVPSFVSCSKKSARKRYELEGGVVAVDLASRILTVAHEDVPGLMLG